MVLKEIKTIRLFPVLVATLGFLWSDLLYALDVEARLSWSKRVELGTPVKGIIKSVYVEPGQVVEKGTVLLELDQRGFKAHVVSQTASLNNLQAIRAEAKRELERAEVMYERTLLSDHELQVKKNEYIGAQAAYDVGRAQLVQAKLELENSAIRAPFDAIVVSRNAEVGQTVVPDLQPVVLLTVADVRNMRASGYITEKQLGSVRLGMNASVETAGQIYNGRISAVGLEPATTGKSEHGRYPLTVTFPVNEQTLHVGQPAKIILP